MNGGMLYGLPRLASLWYHCYMQRLPSWIRVRFGANGLLNDVERLLRQGGLHTVCEGAHCPNRGECYGRGTAAFMILGAICTRNCSFCAVEHGVPAPPDASEPIRVAEAAVRLRLRHVVVTSVTRDDLPDGGAGMFAEVIRAIHARDVGIRVEVLVPDFNGSVSALETVLRVGPEVLNHNVETVRRLQRVIRPQADYQRSLGVLAKAARWRGPRPLRVKSGLMLGLGETPDEIDETLRDLRAVGCQDLTIGQYLRPSDRHTPVARFVTPDEFSRWRERALVLGFAAVASGPLVRSSYWADRLYEGAEVSPRKDEKNVGS